MTALLSFLSLLLAAAAAANPPPAPAGIAPASTAPQGPAAGTQGHDHNGRDGRVQQPDSDFEPSLESARANGLAVFNAVHDAMRQFGSSWHHNGMSVIPAVVPRGVLLYHGSHSPHPPRTLDWLAFEVEHAENFARSWRRRPRRRYGGGPGPGYDYDMNKYMSPLDLALQLQSRDWLDDEEAQEERSDDDDDELLLGYLHTYRATRPLNLLYIDGMAAAKTWYGTLDTQDLLLTHAPGRQPMDEGRRGEALCNASASAGWAFDGFIRMEPGFEIIFCDFVSDGAGLELVAPPAQQAGPDDPAYADADEALLTFEWVRAVAERYHDIGAGRVRLDFSAMVSAFFYPLNLTNPDPDRPELPRLTQATEAQLATMRGRLTDVLSRREPEDSVDWQGVTDSKLFDLYPTTRLKKRHFCMPYRSLQGPLTNVRQ